MNRKRTSPETALKLRRERPETYEEVVRLLSAGLGMLKIARHLKMDQNIVIAVRNMEEERVGDLREGRRKNLGAIADQQIERLMDDPYAVPAPMAGMLIEQVMRQQALLENRPTFIVGTLERVDIHDLEGWRAKIAALPTVEGEIVEEVLKIEDKGE